MDREPSTARQGNMRLARAFIGASAFAIASCSLFIDTSGFEGRPPDEAGTTKGEGGADGHDAPGPDSTTDASCVDGATAAECVAQEIPTDGLILWLRTDDSVETSADGRVITWRDSLPKLRPGYVGRDAKQTDAGAQPLRVVDTAGAAVSFGPNDTLELPPGFDDFSAGLSMFVAVWPLLDGAGGGGPLFALGFPPQQDDCGRLAELSIGGYGFGYRVENQFAEVQGVLDGRGWDVVSVVHGGWNGSAACAKDAPVTFRRGPEIKGTGTALSLTKAVRSGTRLGRSMYFPDEYFSGKLGELLLYDRALDDTQATRVATYLSRRWPRP